MRVKYLWLMCTAASSIRWLTHLWHYNATTACLQIECNGRTGQLGKPTKISAFFLLKILRLSIFTFRFIEMYPVCIWTGGFCNMTYLSWEKSSFKHFIASLYCVLIMLQVIINEHFYFGLHTMRWLCFVLVFNRFCLQVDWPEGRKCGFRNVVGCCVLW
jgi:hypothetical protein